MTNQTLIAKALMETLISPNVSNARLDPANLVDVGDRIAAALWKLARTDDPQSVGAIEAHGQAMITAADILAKAIRELAQVLRESRA